MPEIAVAFYALLAVAVGMFVVALVSSPRMALPGAILSYVLAFVSGFSIGSIVLVLTFIFVAIAVVNVSRFQERRHRLCAAACGALVWVVAVRAVDDFWLFLPFSFGKLFF